MLNLFENVVRERKAPTPLAWVKMEVATLMGKPVYHPNRAVQYQLVEAPRLGEVEAAGWSKHADA